MICAARERVPRLRRYSPVIWTVLTGVVASAVLFWGVRRWESEMLREELRKQAVDRVEILRTQILRSMEVLHSIKSLYASRPTLSVTREEFRRFVADALNRQPELQALAWDAYVPAAERVEWEKRAQREGFAEFHFTEEVDSDVNRLVPAGVRAEYFPVFFLEALAKNERALGFDVGSEERRRVALQEARAKDMPIATAPIQLTQGDLGFLVFLPVYPGGEGGGPAHFSGFAVAVFRINDLVKQALLALRESHVAVSIFDTESGGSAIYSQWTDAGDGKLQDGLACGETLDVAGRKWSVVFSPSSAFVRERSTHWSWAAFGAGLVCTGLVGMLVHGSRRKRKQIERSVREKTAALSTEIAERTRAEQALKAALDGLEIRVRERTAELAQSNTALLAEIIERKQAEDIAAAANKAKSVFLANMSHEIRTPLNAILGYSQILQRDAALAPFQRDAVATIASSGQHLLHLVNEILDLSKIEADRMELQPDKFDLLSLTRELAAMFQQRCEEKGLGLRIEWLGNEERRMVEGDEGKLRQVLINLLGNAVKFTDEGHVSLRVTPEPENRCRFEVEDTGIGVPPGMAMAIFEPFQQGAIKGQSQRGGTGLGLAIASRQVELMGGKVELRSESGKGSTFFFTIPLSPVTDQDRPLRTQRVVKSLAPGSTVRALVVDDIEENRDVISRLLEAMGCTVDTASDGLAAIEAVAATRPDIVFMDMRLPGMSGIDATRQLVQKFGREAPCIVSMSASVLQHERDECLRAGCDDFIGKPVQEEQLYECLHNLLHVELVDETSSAVAGPGAQVDLTQIALPEDLALRLMMAAELHSATVLKNCLRELAGFGPEEERLAEHLRGFLASYDMETILKIVAQLPVQSANT
ncbi:MAG TPA: CHASE domain-containing protein [Chthoniobacterales bacterium]